MRAHLRIFAIASALVVALGLSLASCATLPRVVGAETAVSIETNALKAARSALTIWSLAQQSALIYGRLPTCDAELPDLKVCKDRALWQRIKAIDAEYSAKIAAARPLIEAGTDDAAILVGVAALVNEGVIEMNKAKGVIQ